MDFYEEVNKFTIIGLSLADGDSVQLFCKVGLDMVVKHISYTRQERKR